MKASVKFRQLVDSPVALIARYYFDKYIDNVESTPLGEYIFEIKTGKTPSKANQKFYSSADFNWFKPDEIGRGPFLENSENKLSKYAVESNQVTVYKPNTILINCIGDIGRLGILKNSSSSNQQITGILLQDRVLPEYAYYYLLSHRYLLSQDASTTTLPIINQKKLISIPFIYQNKEEQLRIIELLNYALDCFENSIKPTFSNFQFKKAFISECNKFFNLNESVKTIESELQNQSDLIKKLRQSILQDAVQGKLSLQVEAISNKTKEEDAQQLLQNIKAEKQKLITEGKLKKDKELAPISPDEIPFELPEGWAWCRLGEIMNTFLGGYAFKSEDLKESGMNQVLRLGNVKNDRISFNSNPVFISNDIASQALSNELSAGDILITMTGTRLKRDYCFTKLITKEDLIAKRLFINQRVGCMRFSKLLNLKYINTALKADNILDAIFLEETGTANQGNIGVGNIKSIPFPLPPISEQERIVAKVEELMQTCDALEKEVEQSKKQIQYLMQSVLREAFEGKEI